MDQDLSLIESYNETIYAVGIAGLDDILHSTVTMALWVFAATACRCTPRKNLTLQWNHRYTSPRFRRLLSRGQGWF